MTKYNIRSRVSRIRELHKTFWIFCGGKTEKMYFDALKKDYPNIRIESRLCGKASINLFDFTKGEIKKMKRDTLDFVFIIFDRDEGNNTREQLEYVISEAITNKIEPIISNKSFEVRLLMHFENFSRCVSSVEEYERALSGYLGSTYNKVDPEIYEKTKNKISVAIENSKNIENYHRNNTQNILRFCEPYTEVYKLIEKIIQS